MDKSLYEKIKKPFFVNDNLDTYNISELRRTFSDKILVDLLFAANCLDIPSNKDPEETKRYVSGVYYRKMPNGMLVTCYLNLKNFGTNIKFLVDVAYELVAHTMNYFCSDHNTLDDFDYFIVPNNTALFLSTLIQTIIGKPVISIDRLGPIPTLLPYDEPLINSLAQKKVIVIEEVIATGSEVDRTIQYLHHLKVHVNEVIAIYNLEVGKPALISEKNIFSLCKPKKELRYEYRSQFSEETTVKELEQ